MKLKTLFLLALAALVTFATPRPARADDVSFDFFYDALSPHGEWIEVGDYGYCWRPAGVDEDWAPYSDGYWTYTDAGWTWVSYEDYGGIVYHYGRWVKLEDEGWCWVPDYEWGPAWVSWRKNDNYVGWAPLPAEAHWRRDRGISVWVDTSYDISPTSYNFCRFHDFGAPVLRPVIIRRSENLVIINNTVNITNISYNTNSGYIFNGGLDYGYVNRFARRPIPALKLVRNNNITVVNNHIVNNNVRVTNFNAVQRGNQLTIIAPTMVRPQPAQVAALLQPKVTKVIPQQKVTKGWGSVPADQRAAIRAKFQQETAGKTPETTVAAPVRAAELKVVPVKADPKAKLPTVNPKVPESPVTADGATVPGAATPLPLTPPAKVAGEKIPGRKPGKFAPPPPADAPDITANPPPAKVVGATPPPIAKQRPLPTRPGIVKPFNPQADDNAPTGTARMTATPPPNNAPVEKRNAAAEAAKERAAAQAAARQQAMDAKNAQREVARRNNAQEAAEARQRMLQQQSLQQNQQDQKEQAVTRKRAADAPQMQQNQQQQALRERAAQAAEARQRSAEAQHAQAAAARQQALERQAAARQSAPPVQQQRNLPPAVQRNLPPANQPQKVPPKPGKKPLTPEEAAQQQQQQQVR